MARFVLLLHECPNNRPRHTHCDLMFEIGDRLRTWSLAQLPRDWKSLPAAAVLPPFAPSNSVEAELLADHRLAYLDYEGPVSGDRGTVRRLDEGTFTRQSESNAFVLSGRVLHGEILLHQPPHADASWTLEFRPIVQPTD